MTRLSMFLAIALAATASFAQVEDEPVLVTSAACYSCHRGAQNGSMSHGNHAVGVDYEEARRNRRTLRPSTSTSGFGSTVANDFLVDGKVECTSCHYTHAQETTTPYRLRLPDPNREPVVPGVRVVSTSLCVNCHDLSRL